MKNIIFLAQKFNRVSLWAVLEDLKLTTPVYFVFMEMNEGKVLF